MVESEMADLAHENGLRSREVCQGLGPGSLAYTLQADGADRRP
jgi:hypothetical protein